MTRPALLLLLVVLTALAAGAPAAEAAAPKPLRLSWVRCFSLNAAPCPGTQTVVADGALKLAAVAGPRARILWRDKRGRERRTRPWWRTGTRIWVRVPKWAASGPVRVVEGRRRSNPRQVSVEQPLGSAAAAFGGDAMWIWQLEKVEGGDPDAIISRARAAGLEAVFVKAADGGSLWSQFSSELIARLKAAGLRVCAWQYVYGADPEKEAATAAAAIARGADCFVIDAESEYEGRYAAAQRYVGALRTAVGPAFPIALSTFPYVNYHPSFPYSVFLGPGAAQANLPQMYWKAIGVTPDRIFEATYSTNLPYDRPILPLGQLYEAPTVGDVQRFRALATGYGARGVSWWSWQHASGIDWQAAFGQPAPAAVPATPTWVAIGPGSRGDLVIRAQELLRGGGAALPVSGSYGSLTEAAIRGLQTARGLPETGAVDEATWRELLRFAPEPADWAAQAARR